MATKSGVTKPPIRRLRKLLRRNGLYARGSPSSVLRRARESGLVSDADIFDTDNPQQCTQTEKEKPAPSKGKRTRGQRSKVPVMEVIFDCNRKRTTYQKRAIHNASRSALLKLPFEWLEAVCEFLPLKHLAIGLTVCRRLGAACFRARGVPRVVAADSRLGVVRALCTCKNPRAVVRPLFAAELAQMRAGLPMPSTHRVLFPIWMNPGYTLSYAGNDSVREGSAAVIIARGADISPCDEESARSTTFRSHAWTPFVDADGGGGIEHLCVSSNGLKIGWDGNHRLDDDLRATYALARRHPRQELQLGNLRTLELIWSVFLWGDLLASPSYRSLLRLHIFLDPYWICDGSTFLYLSSLTSLLSLAVVKQHKDDPAYTGHMIFRSAADRATFIDSVPSSVTTLNVNLCLVESAEDMAEVIDKLPRLKVIRTNRFSDMEYLQALSEFPTLTECNLYLAQTDNRPTLESINGCAWPHIRSLNFSNSARHTMAADELDSILRRMPYLTALRQPMRPHLRLPITRVSLERLCCLNALEVVVCNVRVGSNTRLDALRELRCLRRITFELGSRLEVDYAQLRSHLEHTPVEYVRFVAHTSPRQLAAFCDVNVVKMHRAIEYVECDYHHHQPLSTFQRDISPEAFESTQYQLQGQHGPTLEDLVEHGFGAPFESVGVFCIIFERGEKINVNGVVDSKNDIDCWELGFRDIEDPRFYMGPCFSSDGLRPRQGSGV